jgi:hypothetical protein
MGYLTCDIDENKLYIKENKGSGVCHDALWEVCYQGDIVYLRHYIYKKVLSIDFFGKVELSNSLDDKLILKAVVPRSVDLETRELVNLKYENKILACKRKFEKVYLNKLLEHCESQYSYRIV